MANVRHNGSGLDSGSFTVDFHHSQTDEWFEVQDLDVRKTNAQMVSVSESYLQVWERTIERKKKDSLTPKIGLKEESRRELFY